MTLNIENNKAETGFSNYLEVELSNDSDSVKVGALVNKDEAAFNQYTAEYKNLEAFLGE
ncbi:hypothetical protein [Staphylococcus aureus]|uniref:hypothetical protein n=1 Tax=Staphylococcus aureus TaxID=1280 RepID=UPI002109D1B6|nr:hypothetical protein [Staphylococcus aureus]